jgi:hypothetical protein
MASFLAIVLALFVLFSSVRIFAFKNGCHRTTYLQGIPLGMSSSTQYKGEDREQAKLWEREWVKAQENRQDLSTNKEAYAFSNRRLYDLKGVADEPYSPEERREEEEWNIKMRIARATATATSDIMKAATSAAVATANATIGSVLRSA